MLGDLSVVVGSLVFVSLILCGTVMSLRGSDSLEVAVLSCFLRYALLVGYFFLLDTYILTGAWFNEDKKIKPRKGHM